MKIRCLHGYFILEETSLGQISDFINYSGLPIAPKGDQYTFEKLALAPEHSFKGAPFLGFTATENFEGRPWEVFAANGCVYDFSRDLVVPILSIKTVTLIEAAGNFFVSPGFILPGSLTAEGKRVKDYAAWFRRDTQRFYYSEVTYV